MKKLIPIFICLLINIISFNTFARSQNNGCPLTLVDYVKFDHDIFKFIDSDSPLKEEILKNFYEIKEILGDYNLELKSKNKTYVASYFYLSLKDEQEVFHKLSALKIRIAKSKIHQDLLDTIRSFEKVIKKLNLKRKNYSLSLSDFDCMNSEGKMNFLKEKNNPLVRFFNIEKNQHPQLNRKEALLFIKSALHDETSTWGDTILEGDFAKTGEAHVEKTEFITFGFHFIGIRFQIVADAIMTGTKDCKYNEKSEKHEGKCTKGKFVVEQFYDRNFIRIDDNSVEFVDKQKQIKIISNRK